jgi:ABC-2 type transport system ATP-binding protein
LAVDHVSFHVMAGEVFGFLGPNGAGKTTTQRMLTGILEPTEGAAYVLDHDMSKDPTGAKEHVGVVPEVANPYVELSGWQNLIFMGELYGLRKHIRQERSERLLREFELWQKKDEPAKRYSKGMKQRLLLAMAMLHSPQVLFLDEPTAGLDVNSRRMINQRIKQLAEQGVAIFYTTHNIEEANMLCDRVAIIRKGRVVALNTPEALKSAFTESQSVLAAFNKPINPEALAQLNRVYRVDKDGDKFRLHTACPGTVAMMLTDFARRQRLEIVSINTYGPSLEDVFVALSSETSKNIQGTER